MFNISVSQIKTQGDSSRPKVATSKMKGRSFDEDEGDDDNFVDQLAQAEIEQLQSPPLIPERKRDNFQVQSEPLAASKQDKLPMDNVERSQAVKLGSRLAMTNQALRHNEATLLDKEVVSLAKSQDGRKGFGSYRESDISRQVSASAAEAGDVADVEATRSVGGFSDIASSANLSFQSAATVTSIPLKVKKPPSLFAQGVVQDLGLEGESAVAAMKVIDEVVNLKAILKHNVSNKIPSAGDQDPS